MVYWGASATAACVWCLSVCRACRWDVTQTILGRAVVALVACAFCVGVLTSSWWETACVICAASRARWHLICATALSASPAPSRKTLARSNNLSAQVCPAETPPLLLQSWQQCQESKPPWKQESGTAPWGVDPVFVGTHIQQCFNC